MNNEQKVIQGLNDCRSLAKDIDNAAASMVREHRIMFGALAELREAMPAHLGEGNDYLTQLLDYRRKSDEVLKRTWEMLGLA
jgi:hypothetical protein